MMKLRARAFWSGGETANRLSGMSRGKLLAFRAVLVLIVVLILEGLALVAIMASRRLLPEPIRRTPDILAEQARWIDILMRHDQGREEVDPVLGWRYRSGHSSASDRMNSIGLRSTREYAAAPAPGALRIAAFGDSFVYCNEVANEEAWPYFMEQLFPGVEVLNYGVGGYGTDQALLRFRQEGMKLAPRVVLIGFAPVNLGRAVNVYRRFISNEEWALAKPRFLLNGHGLDLVPAPLRNADDYAALRSQAARLRALGQHDYWYEPVIYDNPLYDWSATMRVAAHTWVLLKRRYLDPNRLQASGAFNRSSEAFQVQTAILRTFAEEVKAAGADPVVIVLPDRKSVDRARAGKGKAYDPLVEYLTQAGIVHVDLVNALVRASANQPVGALFAPGGHYSGAGNRAVATWLGEWMQKRYPPAAARAGGL
jgi:hypothetical protein